MIVSIVVAICKLIGCFAAEAFPSLDGKDTWMHPCPTDYEHFFQSMQMETDNGDGVEKFPDENGFIRSVKVLSRQTLR